MVRFGDASFDLRLPFVGVAVLALAPLVWIGVRWVVIPAYVLSGLAVPAGLFGLYGLSVITERWTDCRSLALASLASSFPSTFCQANDWVADFGTGWMLIAMGAAGVVT